MTIISPVFVWKFGASNLLENHTLAELLGLRTAGSCLSSLFKNFLHRVTKARFILQM